jgi:hypothetical protein
MRSIGRFTTRLLAASVAAVLSGGFWASHASANLLTDPGFEGQVAAPNPDPTGVPGWANFGGAQFSSTYARTGTESLWSPNEGGGYSVPGSYQVFAASPGENFTFSGWVYTPDALVSGSNDFAILQMSFFSGSPPSNYAGGTNLGTVGVNVGTPAGGGGVPLPQGVWTYASISGTAPAGTNSIGAYVLGINADANSDFYFDDMSLNVPEPTSLGLLGIGGLALIRRRRA